MADLLQPRWKPLEQKVRWKLSNILAMAESKREDSFARLERVLQGLTLG